MLLSNDFSAVYDNPNTTAGITNAIKLMTYCAEVDPLAERLLYILEEFNNVVLSRRAARIIPPIPQAATVYTVANVPSVDFASMLRDTSSTISLAGDHADRQPRTLDILLDFQGFATPSMASDQDESSLSLSEENEIDFDAFWKWPQLGTLTGAAATGFDGQVQGISDSAVPLFGMAAIE